jgi:hypothetical protein
MPLDPGTLTQPDSNFWARTEACGPIPHVLTHGAERLRLSYTRYKQYRYPPEQLSPRPRPKLCAWRVQLNSCQFELLVLSPLGPAFAGDVTAFGYGSACLSCYAMSDQAGR